MHPTDRKHLFYKIIVGLLIITLAVIQNTYSGSGWTEIIPFALLGLLFLIIKPQIFAENEKRDYDKIQNYPDLMCKKHRTRVILKRWFIFKNIQCRINENCNKNDIIRVKQIIGLFGKPIGSSTTEDNYYFIIGDRTGENIINGDFDIIEIHNVWKVENFDATINKMVKYFFNEVDRYKPINQVIVRVFDNIELSENTKRLLEKHFLKVEYMITKDEEGKSK